MLYINYYIIIISYNLNCERREALIEVYPVYCL